MLRRFGQAIGVAALAVVMLGADNSEAHYNRVGHKLMCACSCGQILVECNHVGCPDSNRMIGELRAQLAGGSDDGSVLNWFAQKYGATVLAAPMRGGFDTVAWIAPIAFFILATFGTAFVVRSWAHRRQHSASLVTEPGMAPGSNDMRARIRREMEL